MAPKWVTLPSLAVYRELTFHQFNHSGCRSVPDLPVEAPGQQYYRKYFYTTAK